MDAPAKRVQSPISTSTRRSPLHSLSPGDRLDALVNAMEGRGEQFHLFHLGLIGELQHRGVETLPVQPRLVLPGPRRLLRVADTVAEQDCVHVLAGTGIPDLPAGTPNSCAAPAVPLVDLSLESPHFLSPAANSADIVEIGSRNLDLLVCDILLV